MIDIIVPRRLELIPALFVSCHKGVSQVIKEEEFVY